MIPIWIGNVIGAYICIDLLIGMYFKSKYQGPYSDGKVHTYTPTPLLTIPVILIYALLGKSHVVQTLGVHKITWKEYQELNVQSSSRTEE